ncbi:murein hydrolase activator EnvC family protein [Ruminococcus albus]|uniref:murein hydrolase activator EnvC family protein n=1 Tax=Ruminococcus albus TaxID=1264 RepID=UPI0004B193D1|nr:M23 family metallopeptidase [Ruminococcus albus]
MTQTPADSGAVTGKSDVTKHAEDLRYIIGKQSALKVEISDAETAIREEEKMLKSIRKRTEELDNELYILNRSMSVLELQVNSNRRELDRINGNIENGVERLKMRMRALYLSGSDSYTTVLLESNSFYDILMRMELIKRVAEHDDRIIEELYALQDTCQAKQANLDKQQAELDKQYALFDAKKAKLDEIYNSSAQAKELLREKQKKLKEQEAQFNLEKIKTAESLGAILMPTIGAVPFDEEVAATEELANERLKELHENIKQRVKDGEEIPENEPTYTFAWPVPQDYTINSGVGARWGTYHKGVDINGDHGYEIHACETGTVIMTNTTCTHDYGKYESCGCGGGYGNFIIIDHGNDFLTLYGHLTKVLVEPGAMFVKTGRPLSGLMGTTGYSTGDHLHLEIRYQGICAQSYQIIWIWTIDPNGGDRPLVNDKDEDTITVC